MPTDPTETRPLPPLSETARARLRDLEARAAMAHWQATAGLDGSPFIAGRASRFKQSISAQLQADSGSSTARG